MPSPLFQNQPQRGSSIFAQVREALKGQPDSAIEAFGRQMYESNPAFRDFVNPMRGKSPEQICQEKGVDYNQIWGNRR